MVTTNPQIQKRAYTITEFRDMGGPCRTGIYDLLKSGALHAVKRQGRTVILAEEVERYFASLPEYNGRAA